MGAPWNGWYHCVAGTYGSWLPGDPRGFRTRHHREHVDGDYKNPPPEGMYTARHAQSQGHMKHGRVVLSVGDRRIVCEAVVECLSGYGVELIDLSVGGQHVHTLCRFPRQLSHGTPGNLLRDGRNPIPRHVFGRAKRAASMAMLQAGRKEEGQPLWAKREKIKPIEDRAHQLAVVNYIRRHADEGAVVWSLLQKGTASSKPTQSLRGL